MAKQKVVIPTEYSLRSFALKYEVSARTIIKAIMGEAIRGARAHNAAHAAADEWSAAQPKPATKRTRVK